MREMLISIVSVCIISTVVYVNINSDINKDKVLLSQTSSTSSLKKFKSGISIRDIGDLVIIEQKPDGTVIIDKDDLEDIIVFLNNTNSSEE